MPSLSAFGASFFFLQSAFRDFTAVSLDLPFVEWTVVTGRIAHITRHYGPLSDCDSVP